MNGIHEVTGSIPVWSTNLRSRPVSASKNNQKIGSLTERRAYVVLPAARVSHWLSSRAASIAVAP